MDSDSTMPPLAVLAEHDPLIKLCKQGDSHALRSLLSGYPTQFVPSYINTPDSRGTPALFHCILSGCPPSVHVLLSFGAHSNGTNARNDTPLHCACESGQIEIILLLLAYEANPHLINMHGQRCYEMGTQTRTEKLKIEAMIKQAWQDIRRDKEIKQQAIQHQNTKMNNQSDNQSTDQSTNQSTNRRSSLKSSASRTSVDSTPLLSAALGWSPASVVAERARWRAEAEQRELADNQSINQSINQSSLFDKLAEQVEQENRAKQRSRASIIHQLNQKSTNRPRFRQSINQSIDLERQSTTESLERIARDTRLDEIRAVMAEYCMLRNQSAADSSKSVNQSISPSSKSINQSISQSSSPVHRSSQARKVERILGRMFAHFCWALDIQEKHQQKVSQSINQSISQPEQKTQVFLTSIDQEEEEDELPPQIELEATIDQSVIQPDPHFAMLKKVADRYKNQSINQSTRAHLTAILTQLGTTLPPSDLLAPKSVNQSINQSINQSNQQSFKKTSIPPHSSDIQSTSQTINQPLGTSSFARTKSQTMTEFWRIAQWDESKSPSHQSISQSINQSTRRPVNQTRDHSNQSINQSISSASHQANLSAMVMQQINSQINQQTKNRKKNRINQPTNQSFNQSVNQSSGDQSTHQSNNQSINQSITQLDRAQREAFILSVFPHLTPSDTLFELLLASPINQSVNQSINQSNDEDLLAFFQSSNFLPSPEALNVMFNTLQEMERKQSIDQPINKANVTSPTDKKRRLRIQYNQSINQPINQPLFPSISPSRIPPHLPADTELVSHAAPFFHL